MNCKRYPWIVKTLLLTALFGFTSPSAIWADGDEHEEEVGQQFLFFLEEAYTQEQGEYQLDVSSLYQTKLHTHKVESGGEIKDTETATWDSGVALEYGITDWMQVEVSVPYLHVNKKVLENDGGDIEPSWTRDGGIGDISAGLGFCVLREDAARWWQPTVAVELEVMLPTGDYKKGLGTDRTGYEFGLSASKTFDDWVVHSGIGVGFVNDAKELEEGAVEKEDERELEGGLAAVYQPTETLDLIGELYVEHEREKGSEGTNNSTALYFTPGFKIEAVDDLEIGLGIPLGLTDDSYDWGLFAKMIFEW